MPPLPRNRFILMILFFFVNFMIYYAEGLNVYSVTEIISEKLLKIIHI